MSQQYDIDSLALNEVPDIYPTELPGRDLNPSIEDRIAQIESVLNIN